MFRISLFIYLTFLLTAVPAFAFDSKFESVTVKPKEFCINQALKDVYALVDSENVKLFKNKNEEMDTDPYRAF